MSQLKLSPTQAAALVEKTKRASFALDMFRPQLGPQEDYFLSEAPQIALLGGNRSGKSTCAAVRFAAFVMNKDITLRDGRKIPGRKKKHQNIGKPAVCFVIAYDQSSIGRNIYRLLFKPGAFLVIRDKVTKQWRAFSYADPEDMARRDEAKPAPPLIPARYIAPKSFTWEQKSSNQFTQVKIWDPVTKEITAEIHAFSSKAETNPQGDEVYYCWIDEALYNGGYKELVARLATCDGALTWSSYPKTGASELRELSITAKEQKDWKQPLVQEFLLSTSGNEEMDPEGKKKFLDSLSPEERQQRDYGYFLTDNLKMYPLYSSETHCAFRQCPMCKSNKDADCPCKETDDDLAAILRANNGQAPRDWCRELILDPGTSNPGVLLCAVPPPDLGDYLVVLEELYPGRKDANQLAPLIKQKTGNLPYNRFIIDQNAGRQTSMGQTYSVADTYAHAFQRNGLKCKVSGSHFIFGSNNVGARIALVQEAMHCNEEGKPRLRIVNHMCPTLCKQLQETLKAEASGDPIDDRHAKGQKVDLVHCLEYWVASLPFYVEPPLENQSSDPKWKWFQAWKARNKKSDSSSETLGPQYEPAKI